MRRPGLVEAILRLRQARLESLAAIGALSPADLDRPTSVSDRSVRGMLWMMHEHYLDHAAQIRDARRAAGTRTHEVHALIACAQGSFERAMAYLIGVPGGAVEFSPGLGEWSIREVMDHLLEFELRYKEEFERLLFSRVGGRQ